MQQILFNNIPYSAQLAKNIAHLVSDYASIRDKVYSNYCLTLLKHKYKNSHLLLTHSATGALDMIASLIDIKQGDEIIIPSFTYVSTANAFVSRGATPVFVDIDSRTLCIDAACVEKAITLNTKAIIAVHYAGHSGNIQYLKQICEKYNLILVEDAAMSYGYYESERPLGTCGDFGVISFDITKHITSVNGGLLVINNPAYALRANHIYDVGTNRHDFLQGKVSHYEWVDQGSKYQINELCACVLYDNLINEDSLLAHMQKLTNEYTNYLQPLAQSGDIQIMDEQRLTHNYHEFYVLVKTPELRNQLIRYLSEQSIQAVSHYYPLHLSEMGKKFNMHLSLPITEQVATCIVRLPMHQELSISDVNRVAHAVLTFFNS